MSRKPDTIVFRGAAANDFFKAMVAAQAPTQAQALAARGLTHLPSAGLGVGRKDILDGSGTVVASGTAHEIWQWLKTQAAP